VLLGFAFTGKNVAMGATYASFGLLIRPLVAEFSAAVSEISMAIALLSLAMGTAAPVVGRLLDAWSIRGTIVGGCVLAALGFLLAALAQSAWQFVVCYGVIVGVGISAMGAVPAAKLAAVAFPDSRGKAIGFAMLPLSSIAAPLLLAPLLEIFGWRAVLAGFALGFAALALVALAVIGAQRTIEPAPDRSAPGADRAPPAQGLGRHGFAKLALASGMLLSSGIVMITYLVPYARSLGIDARTAAVLLAVTGVAAIPGAYVFAWLADKISLIGTLACNAALQSLLWLLMAALHAPDTLWPLAFVLGFCVGGANPAVTVLVSKVYSGRFGTMLGKIALAVIPFNFASTPVVGWFFDKFATYRGALLLEASLCATALVLILSLRNGYRPAPRARGEIGGGSPAVQ
jgi:MFS family permease